MTYPSPQHQSAALAGVESTFAAPMPDAQPPPRRQLAGVALLVSAGLAVGGSLLPYAYTAYSVARGGPAFTAVTNLWRTSYSGTGGIGPVEPGHDYIPGIPLMVAAALAVLAGVALLRTARYPGHGPGLWAVAAGGALAGLTATDCLAAEATHSRQGLFLNTLLTARYGAGMWLLLAAGLVAVGGVMAAALADRSGGPRFTGPTGPADPADPAGAAAPAGPIVYAIPDDDEPRTPPTGFPAQPEP